jgi:hypothetical protein
MHRIGVRFAVNTESTKRLIWFVRFRSELVAEDREQIFRESRNNNSNEEPET